MPDVVIWKMPHHQFTSIAVNTDEQDNSGNRGEQQREVRSGNSNPHQKGCTAALETRKYNSLITSY
jgi:hypothetical protein